MSSHRHASDDPAKRFTFSGDHLLQVGRQTLYCERTLADAAAKSLAELGGCVRLAVDTGDTRSGAGGQTLVRLGISLAPAAAPATSLHEPLYRRNPGPGSPASQLWSDCWLVLAAVWGTNYDPRQPHAPGSNVVPAVAMAGAAGDVAPFAGQLSISNSAQRLARGVLSSAADAVLQLSFDGSGRGGDSTGRKTARAQKSAPRSATVAHDDVADRQAITARLLKDSLAHGGRRLRHVETTVRHRTTVDGAGGAGAGAGGRRDKDDTAEAALWRAFGRGALADPSSRRGREFRRVCKTFELNEYIRPSVGDGVVTLPGMLSPQWSRSVDCTGYNPNFHFAACVLVKPGSWFVTIENWAVADTGAINESWGFCVWSLSERDPDDSFHARLCRSGGYGNVAMTLALRRRRRRRKMKASTRACPCPSPQLLLACSGADRDPKDPMRWLGSSKGHLMLLRHHGAAPLLTPLHVADVGCNAMSMAELPRPNQTSAGATHTTLLLTDMSDPRAKRGDGDNEGSVRLFRVCARQVMGTGGSDDHFQGSLFPAPASPHGAVVATTGGRSPCAVAICPRPCARRADIFLAAVACYEGPAGVADGVVALLELVRAPDGAWVCGACPPFLPADAIDATCRDGRSIGAPAAVASHGAGSQVGGGATPGVGRQDAAHPHGCEWWPTFIGTDAAPAPAPAPPLVLFVADLGANKVVAYTVGQQRNARGEAILSMNCSAVCTLHAGAGPRHMRLVEHSATAATLFVVNELDNTLVAIAVHRSSCGPVHVRCTQKLSTLPADFDPCRAPPFDFYTAASHACALVLHVPPAPAPPLLYVSNRGHDSVATFRVNVDADAAGNGHGGGGSSATAELLGHTSCTHGRLPWDLSLDRTGKIAAVTAQYDAKLQADGGGLALWDVDDGAALLAAAPRSSQPVAVVANVLAVRFLDGGVDV